MTLEQITSVVIEQAKQAATCCHYWVIDPPEGLMSQGVCCYCNEVREFKNVLDEGFSKDFWPAVPGNGRIPISIP